MSDTFQKEHEKKKMLIKKKKKNASQFSAMTQLCLFSKKNEGKEKKNYIFNTLVPKK